MENNPPLVSVIIIFLNEEKFLEEAIESVLAQSYPNWELLLVDDGSEDKSTQIAQHYALQRPQHIYYLDHNNHQNRGMSASRNLGVSRARGTYLAFLDGDDVWLPEKLEEEVGILTKHPEAALVSGQMKYWHSWTNEAEDMQRDFVPEYRIPVDTVIEPPDLLLQILNNDWVGLGCGMLVKKKAVQAVGGFEDAFRGLFEDQVFQAKLCLKFPVYISSKYWYLYRQHPESCCATTHNTPEYKSEVEAFFYWFRSYLTEQGVKNEQAWQFVRRGLRPFRYPLLYRFINAARNLVLQVKQLF